jgi:hypothetical protein
MNLLRRIIGRACSERDRFLADLLLAMGERQAKEELGLEP